MARLTLGKKLRKKTKTRLPSPGESGPTGRSDSVGKSRGAKSGDTRPPEGKSPERKSARSPAVARAKVPFPRRNQPPTEAEFLARLPLRSGKKFESVRTFLKKQKSVAEDLYFYGPKTGWAYRYLRGSHSLATIMIHDDRLMGIVSMDAAALTEVDFGSLSDVGQSARKMAHGSPTLLWLDLPLDGPGASDFRALLKSKLSTLASRPTRPPPPPPARPRG